MIPPVPHVAAMSAYALAALDPPEGAELLSLSQNESLRPPSPIAVAAAKDVLGKAHLYPDPDWTELRQALARHHNIRPDGIVVGSGSLELIACLARVYCDPQNAILAPRHAYPFFRTAAAMVNARFDAADEVDLTPSVDALLDAVNPDTRVVFLANPGNPTGTRVPVAEIRRLRDGLPAGVLLVIDEAYGEFADHLNERCFDLVSRGDTVVLRTFSKAYGLAGLRVGWGVFPREVAGELRKLLSPNNVSAMSQSVATAAIADYSYMRETCYLTAQNRDRLIMALRAIDFDLPESFTNFALIRFDCEARALAADHYLKSHGVVLRPQAGVGLPNCLRVTIGDERACDRVVALLSRWKRGEGQ